MVRTMTVRYNQSFNAYKDGMSQSLRFRATGPTHITFDITKWFQTYPFGSMLFQPYKFTYCDDGFDSSISTRPASIYMFIYIYIYMEIPKFY